MTSSRLTLKKKLLAAIISTIILQSPMALINRAEASESHDSGRSSLAYNGAGKQLNLKTGVSYSPQARMIGVPLIVVSVSPMNIREDGNVAREMQQIVARTTDAVYIDETHVIPRGTSFYGQVVEVYPPRRFLRDGSAMIRFHSFIAPNGEVLGLASESRFSTFDRRAKFEAAKQIGAETTLGALAGLGVGVMVGTVGVIVHPSALLGTFLLAAGFGAAAGGAIGFVRVCSKKGFPAPLPLDQYVTVQIDDDTLKHGAINCAQTPISPSGVSFTAVSSKSQKNPFRIQIEAVVRNDSDQSIDSADLYLEDLNHQRLPMQFDSQHQKSPTLFIVAPHSERHFWTSFEPDRPEPGCKLVWFKHGTFVERLAEYDIP